MRNFQTQTTYTQKPILDFEKFNSSGSALPILYSHSFHFLHIPNLWYLDVVKQLRGEECMLCM